SPLNYDQPVADAGENIVVVLPGNSAILDGTNSYDPGNNPLYYQWTQVYGPSIITFPDNQIAAPEISSLIEGYYFINLEVSNGTYTDNDEIIFKYKRLAMVNGISNPASASDLLDRSKFA
ncbi:hypothetical protein HGB13_04885, partial [bacterium]|nr:hypothetical protein [bacterium]